MANTPAHDSLPDWSPRQVWDIQKNAWGQADVWILPRMTKAHVNGILETYEDAEVAKMYSPDFAEHGIKAYHELQSAIARSMGTVEVRTISPVSIEWWVSDTVRFGVLDTGAAEIAPMSDVRTGKERVVAYPPLVGGTAFGELSLPDAAETADVARRIFATELGGALSAAAKELVDTLPSTLENPDSVRRGPFENMSPEEIRTAYARMVLEVAIMDIFKSAAVSTIAILLSRDGSTPNTAAAEPFREYVGGSYCVHYEYVDGVHAFTMVDVANNIGKLMQNYMFARIMGGSASRGNLGKTIVLEDI